MHYDKLRIWEIRTGLLIGTLNCEIKSREKDLIFKVKQLFRKITGFWRWYGIRALSVHPDGQLIAMSVSEKWVKVWDLQSKRALQTLDGHSSPVTSMAFSADGKFLATSDEKSVVIWNTNTWQQIRKLKDASAPVAFNMAENLIATGGKNKKIILWDLDNSDGKVALKGHSGSANSIPFVHDGKWLASGSEDGTIKIRDVAPSKEVWSWQAYNGKGVKSLTFDPENNLLASYANSSKSIEIWDADTGKPVKAFAGGASYVSSLIMDQGENFLEDIFR